MGKRREKAAPQPALALLLACAVPGAGHAYLGRLQRGIIIFVTITALFWSGVAVGGILTVDAYLEPWWFVAEMLTGIHGLVGWYLQWDQYKQQLQDVRGETIREKIKEIGRDRLDARLQQERIALVAPAETVARAYAGVAGLLNLLCIFDALMLSILGTRGEPTLEETRPRPRIRAKES